MRVSTKLLFDTGTLNIQRNQFDQYKTQNQIATGRKNQSPADDPVAAAQALVVTQAKSVNAQRMESQSMARDSLALAEGELGSLTNVLQHVRERTVQLGNATLTDRERGFIAEELRTRFQDLLAIGNTQNGQGQYLFSGYQGATQPFAIDGATGQVAYAGDDGERLLQVDAARQMNVAPNGSDIFLKIASGNGTFEVRADAGNVGSGLPGRGSVINLAQWKAAPAALLPKDYRVEFRTDSSGTLKYNLTDAAGTTSLLTNAPVGAVDTAPEWQTFTSGQTISFSNLLGGGTDLGIQLDISGVPASGDKFAVQASASKSIFSAVQDLVNLAATPLSTTPGASTLFAARLGEVLTNLDQGMDNVSRVRAGVGSNLLELDALDSASADRALQLETRLSELVDVDYAEAISRLNRQQVQLEAAQRSFVSITSLSLFRLL